MDEQKKEGRPAHGHRGRGRRRSRPPSNRPIPLNKRTGSHFQPGDRQRGIEYFRAGRIRLEVEGTRARAHVEGNEQQIYGVGLDWSQVESDRVLHVFCECQRFAGGKPCKHIWGTLLALAQSGPENQPPGKDRLGIRKDRSASWRDLDLPAGNEAARAPSSERQRPERERPSRTRTRRGQRTQPDQRPSKGTDALHDPAAPWQEKFDAVREESHRLSSLTRLAAAGDASQSSVRFLINAPTSLSTDSLILDVFGRGPGLGGEPGKLKRVSLDPRELEELLMPKNVVTEAAPADESTADESTEDEATEDEATEDEALTGDESPDVQLAVIAALPIEPPTRRGRGDARKTPLGRIGRFRLPQQLYDSVLPYLCDKAILGCWDGRVLGDQQALLWDAGLPWHLALRLEKTAPGGAHLRGCLEREDESVPLSSAVLLLLTDSTQSGPEAGRPQPSTPAIAVFADTITRLDVVREDDLPWITLLQANEEIVFSKGELEGALTTLLELPNLPRLEAPEELRLTEERSAPEPRLVLESAPGPEWMKPQLLADLSFGYGHVQVGAGDPRASFVDWEERKFLRRDMAGEHNALVRLLELGLQPVPSEEGHQLELSPTVLAAVAEPLLLEGWAVEVHGTSMRPPSPPSLRVESGIDWFELSGSIDFDGDEIDLSEVLKAISRGDHFVPLGDGSQGLLPAAWLETYDSLAKLAQSSSDSGLRFLPSQALLVDALLTAMPPVDVDRAFAELRDKLLSFERIKPKKEPRGFGGTLRGYQREGLGWLDFLREFGLGGVLADDMGLGKTVQALALLRTYRVPSKTTHLPYLVVAPRSLVYNWIDEAARFTPKLRVVEYGGPDREVLHAHIYEYDIVVTTYGTLRRDVGYLATIEFDTVILDEAQAIKNPASQTAKASRLLVARNRLALTGTPIENHLGELGSLFEFLNPGLLGRLPGLSALASGRAASGHELALIADGIRPFILRRTKAQVLPDLPEKTEQVLHCTLRPRQQEIYDKLKAGYQASLMKDVEKKGVAGSAIQVLEALLRLRQVACHPGLVKPEWDDAGSAKLEALFEQVSEVLDEGHKVLVFSQFTKLLGYVRRHLDEKKIEYAYLDGKTRNRGEIVDHFQTDPNCNLFLISLKAGGVGLNLTAAGYVFLLDPWWNPAVEAQAIDRAHRIGQTQPVFAYRMIAQGTVEEKILELQRSKRQIADAILEGEGQSLKDLTADDLRMLLS